MKKRLFGVMMSAAMIGSSMMSMSAFAEEETKEVPEKRDQW